MSNQGYKNQVALLLDVLHHIAKEECFAMHGGTAINLFVLNMPRLSVDIDLTYLPIEDRSTTLQNINNALGRIEESIKSRFPQVQLLNKPDSGRIALRKDGVEIKIEANIVKRGIISPIKRMILCDKARQDYNSFIAFPIVPFGQLYGGKICAALDRQHPRDLFDVKVLLEREGFSDEVRKGFIFCLLSGERPFHEMLLPNFKDQRQAMTNQFSGMSNKAFSYEDFEETRMNLVRTVSKSLTQEDKDFLLSFKNCEPDWSIYNFERFPAVQWKLQNLKKLKENNPNKYNDLFEALKRGLEGMRLKSKSKLGI